MYSCKQCGAEAGIENEALKKSCDCNCGVYMNMGTATLVSQSSMKGNVSSNREKALAILNKILKHFKRANG